MKTFEYTNERLKTLEKKPHLDEKTIKLISNSVNFDIFKALSKKERSVKHISDITGYSDGVIRFHLKDLSNNNLIIRKQRDGRKFVTYAPVKNIQRIFNEKDILVRVSL